jgi:alpha-amylase/alpha-mannosidase (GH57 family)
MLDIVHDHLDKVLGLYTQGEFFSELKEAKEKYFSITGKLDEDKDEFEPRMNSFNDWYIFQYRQKDGSKVIEEYIRNNKLDEELSQAFLNVNHSLFEFNKSSFRKQIILKDILHDEKIILKKDHPTISLMEGDVFTGRVIKYHGESYLLKGVCILPQGVKSILKKQSKRVRKLNSFEEELRFLLQLESLKTKAMHYSHIDPAKIFIFS